MTASNWANAYARERVYEGGKVDDPDDPGGRTAYGITQRVYDAWRRRKNLRPRDVFKIEESEVKSIYEVQYWDAVNGDRLPSGLDFVVLDCAVHSGVKQAVKWLQAALNVSRRKRGVGSINVDGSLGQATLDAVEDDTDNDVLIGNILSMRLAFMQRLKGWKKYKNGWSARVANAKKIGQAWASGSIGPAAVPVHTMGGDVKAVGEKLKTAPVSPQAGAAVATGGGILATGTEKVQEVAGQIQAVSDLSDVLHWIFVALTIAGVALALYALWRNSQAERVKQGEASSVVDDDADEGVNPLGMAA